MSFLTRSNNNHSAPCPISKFRLFAFQETLKKIHKVINSEARMKNGVPTSKSRLNDMFKRFDQDGTGDIDATEFNEGLKSFG